MNNTECPSADQLNHYVTGWLALNAHEAIEQHLETCDACQQATETLDESSGALILGFPRMAVEPAFEFDPDLRQLVDKAKALGAAAFRRRETSALGETLPCSGVQFARGTTLGNYVLDETVGGGNMGFVFRAYHKRMKRDVALKFISPQLMRSQEARKRFQREIEAVAKLNHPNIVAAYDADEVDGYCFLVLELIKGRDLREVIRSEGPVSVDRALAYVRDAAAGLAHAHEVGIIHRDVKASNLLLDEQGIVKVLDLGLARIQFAGDNSLGNEVTQTGDLAGTPAYMSPEQWSGIQEADCRSDIYSLGCTLYQLVTGKPLFGDRSTIEMALAHRDQTAPSICDSRTDCPQEVENLFKSMVAKRPEDRPQSMQQIVTEIETLLAKLQRGDLAAKVHRHDSRRHTAIWITTLVAAAIVIALSFGQFAPNPSETDNNLDVSAADTEPLENREVNVEVETPIDLELTSEPVDAERPEEPIEPETTHKPSDANHVDSKPPNTSSNIEPAQTEPEARNTPQIELVRITPGRFTMGSPVSDMTAGRDEKPAHAVEISKPFMIGKFEITVEQYTDVMETRDRQIQTNQTDVSQPTVKLSQRLPIAGISWHDAIRFCNLLSKRHGLVPYYTVEDKTVSVQRNSNGFRLPTEAEWEFACRANTQTRWHFGDNEEKLEEYAWYAKNSGGRVHAVGSKKPNLFGLHDMHGNVPEWCWDRHDPDYYAESEAIDPPGSSRGTRRVFRGGGTNNRAAQTRSAVRSPLGMSYGFLNNVGLRVVRNAPK